VPAVVVRRAVAIVLAVRLVVLLVVADEVVQRETVMRGDEVDAGPGPAAALVEQVGRPGQPPRDVADQPAVTAPESAHRVSELVVPLRPARRKTADLIAAEADIPRLCDQLYPRQHGILPDRL